MQATAPATRSSAAPSETKRNVRYWPNVNRSLSSDASSARSCKFANRTIGADTAIPRAYSPTCAGLPSFASATTMPHWHAEYSRFPERTQVKSVRRRLLKRNPVMGDWLGRSWVLCRHLAVTIVVSAVPLHLALPNVPVLENRPHDRNLV